MAEGIQVLWIVFDEEIADALASAGEAVSYWDKKLTMLELEKREEIIYRILVPYAMLGIGLGYLKDNPHIELATVGPRRPKVPWWASIKQLAMSLFTEPVWVIKYNDEADLRRFLRQTK